MPRGIKIRAKLKVLKSCRQMVWDSSSHRLVSNRSRSTRVGQGRALRKPAPLRGAEGEFPSLSRGSRAALPPRAGARALLQGRKSRREERGGGKGTKRDPTFVLRVWWMSAASSPFHHCSSILLLPIRHGSGAETGRSAGRENKPSSLPQPGGRFRPPRPRYRRPPRAPLIRV